MHALAYACTTVTTPPPPLTELVTTVTCDARSPEDLWRTDLPRMVKDTYPRNQVSEATRQQFLEPRTISEGGGEGREKHARGSSSR